jgi:class 3 adenylate cyclase
MAPLLKEDALDDKLARLEAARPWSPRVVSRLEGLIREEEDADLFRINPLTFASQRGLSESEVVDLFLHATAEGLFDMDWLLICPMCACAVESFARLRAILHRFHCPLCHNDYEAAMDDLIAVYFSISPAVRTLRFHHPDTLSPQDYLLSYKAVREGRTSAGESYVSAVRTALRGLSFLEAGASTAFAFEAAPGKLSGFSPDTDAAFVLQVSNEVALTPQRIRLTYDGASFEPAEAVVAQGPVALEIVNGGDRRGILGILQISPGQDEECLLQFDPYLTGKHLLTSQTFKSLFRSEVVGGANGLAIRDIALLFTDIKGSTALYQRIGDLNAFQLVQQHFDQLREVTVRHGGAIVKTIGDAVMAAYPDAAHAVAAALDMRGAIERFNESQPDRAVLLKIGVHHGAAIAVTLNDELDYFGHTVNVASRVQTTADAGEIWVSDEVWRYPGVQRLLEDYPADARTVMFHGIERPMTVMRVGAASAVSE